MSSVRIQFVRTSASSIVYVPDPDARTHDTRYCRVPAAGETRSKNVIGVSEYAAEAPTVTRCPVPISVPATVVPARTLNMNWSVAFDPYPERVAVILMRRFATAV
jgi:hypothetical protein